MFLKNMKKLLMIIFCLLSIQSYGQSVYEAIDTNNVAIAKRIEFVRSYYNSSTKEDAKIFWHPKLRDIQNYNFGTNIEAYSRNNVPRRIRDVLKLEIIELEILNDTLSYVKIEMNDPRFGIVATLKYYMVEDDGTIYLDNAINYERHRFILHKTPNIDYYASPYKSVTDEELMRGSEVIDSLYDVLLTRRDRKRLEVYLCSNIEEMNIVGNMSKYYGRQGGYANSEANFAVYMYESPIHKHEFVHIILSGTKPHNFILDEGIATLFGGLNPGQSYGDGRRLVRDCLKSQSCRIEDLISNRNVLTLNYSMWALICEYIIKKLCKGKLFDMYYDERINEKNLISKVCDMLNISERQLLADLQTMAMDYDK